jgi:hypothetical protein
MVVSLLGWMFGWWYCISALLSPTDDKSRNYPLLSTNASICQFPTFVVTYIYEVKRQIPAEIPVLTSIPLPELSIPEIPKLLGIPVLPTIFDCIFNFY